MYKNCYHKSMFGKGNICVSKHMTGKVIFCGDSSSLSYAGSCDEILKSLYLNVGQLVENIFYDYSTGNIDDVAELLDHEYYEALAILMYNERVPNQEYYEGIRKLFTRAIEGLYKSVLQNKKYKNVLFQLEQCQEKISILDDTEKLNEYIKELNEERRRTMSVLPEASISASLPSLKPKYAIYLKRYGFPECGVFEADKLAAICEELEENNNTQ